MEKIVEYLKEKYKLSSMIVSGDYAGDNIRPNSVFEAVAMGPISPYAHETGTVEGVKLDVLVCNPPYIKNDEVLEESVKDFEPHVALFGGEDGLYFYRKVFEAAPKIMKPKSFMAFEMGWDQKEIMLEEVRKHFGDVRAEVLKDINGKDRMLFVYFNN